MAATGWVIRHYDDRFLLGATPYVQSSPDDPVRRVLAFGKIGVVDTPTNPLAELDILGVTRRAFLGGSAAIAARALLPFSLVGVLAACDSGSDSGPTATTIPPNDPWTALRALRDTVRTSPDHLEAEAERVASTKDVAKIVEFVRTRIATYPSSASGLRDDLDRAQRWGWRAALRCGAGTPREKTELLAELLRRAGFAPEVQVTALALTASELLGRPATQPFAPTTELGEIQRQLAILESGASPVDERRTLVDNDGVTSAGLADTLISLLGETPVSETIFTAEKSASLPVVTMEIDAQRQLLDIYGEQALRSTEGILFDKAPALRDDTDVSLKIQITTTESPRSPIIIFEAAWTSIELAGRGLNFGFMPSATSLDELLAMRPADAGVFMAFASASGPDLSIADAKATARVGSPFSVSGSVYDLDVEPLPDDETRTPRGVLVNDVLVGAGTGDASTVASLEIVDVRSSTFPDMVVGVRPLTSDGATVEDLAATSFTITDDTVPCGFVLERSTTPAQRILILLDGSEPMTPTFLAEGAGVFVRNLADALVDLDSTLQIAVAIIDEGEAAGSASYSRNVNQLAQTATTARGSGKQVWEAVIDAQRLDPTCIVLLTTGQATDANGAPLATVPPTTSAQVQAGPPVVVLGVGAVDSASITAVAAAGRTQAATPADTNEAVEAALSRVIELPPPPYFLRYRAPLEGDRTRTLLVSANGKSGKEDYQSTAAVGRGIAPSITSIGIEFNAGGTRVTRHLAGTSLAEAGQRSPITPAAIDDVRRALFGRYVISIEGAAIPTARILDDELTAKLSLERMGIAVASSNIGEARSGIDEVRVLPNAWWLTHAPLPEDEGALPTFEVGVRAVMHSERLTVGSQGNDMRVRTTDLLPTTRFATAENNAATSFLVTAQRTARLAIASARGESGVVTELGDVALVRVDNSIEDTLEGKDVGAIAALEAAAKPWIDAMQPILLVPAEATPTALWAFDPESGALYGVGAEGVSGSVTSAEASTSFDTAPQVIELLGASEEGSTQLGHLANLSVWVQSWNDLVAPVLDQLRAVVTSVGATPPSADDKLALLFCALASCGGTSIELGGTSRFATNITSSEGDAITDGMSVHDEVARAVGVDGSPAITATCS